MTNKSLIILLSLLSVILLFLIEQVLQFDYLYKTIAKVFVFFAAILIFHYKTSMQTSYLSTKSIDLTRLKISVLLGVSTFIILMAAFLAFRGMIDFAGIGISLSEKNITSDTFLFIGLYVIAGNSFLEEIFFRGFIFKNLQHKSRGFAYLYSSLLFAVYHTAIFLTWFSFGLFLLALSGLFAVGLLFCWLNENNDNIYNSWLVHIMADIAIIVIALIAVF
ncbi:CPBP family intramembrane glutamic endopeptidase [Virgibacillus kekensis]|uniref:CPBP family intramembrane glutamic endopeptidase n=1 Tax=Virgibacillus kekensis TaxID=202261 RepID=A0ABV9DNE8_9BACI